MRSGNVEYKKFKQLVIDDFILGMDNEYGILTLC